MDALTLLAFGFICLACFVTGAKVGQTVSKGESIEMPNPIKAYKQHEARREDQKEQDKFNTILSNIESYDGTSFGQKEVR